MTISELLNVLDTDTIDSVSINGDDYIYIDNYLDHKVKKFGIIIKQTLLQEDDIALVYDFDELESLDLVGTIEARVPKNSYYTRVILYIETEVK